MDLNFVVHKSEKFSANPGKVHFEGLIHFFRYIRYNNTLGLKYYADMNDAPVSDLLRRASIKNDNHLMDHSDYSWKFCPGTGRSKGAYIILYKGGTIDHVIHVSVPVAQSSAESEYNAAYTVGMDLEHVRMLIS